MKIWLELKKSRGSFVSFCVLSLFTMIGLFAPWLSPFSPSEVHEGALRLPPFWMEGGSTQFLFGTDDLGRDVLSRLIHGARISLGVGLMVVALSVSVGTVFGVLAGYVGGWVDSVIMGAVDILMSLPSILLAIVVVSILGPGLVHGIYAVSVVALPGVIRVVRAKVMEEKVKSYVTAAISLGSGHLRVSVVNILPNCLAPIIVQAALGFSDGILNVAALGFLGMGAQPPTSEWGAMLADSKSYIESASWLVTLPGLCILVVVLSFNLLGDGLRDILDPKLRGSR